MLTGKAKIDFEKWLDQYSQKHHKNEWLDNDLYLDEVYLPDELNHALIIEWLDSVGIYVDVEFFRKDIKYEAKFVSGTTDYKNGFRTLGKEFNSRQQATEKAIAKANEIYNSQ